MQEISIFFSKSLPLKGTIKRSSISIQFTSVLLILIKCFTQPKYIRERHKGNLWNFLNTDTQAFRGLKIYGSLALECAVLPNMDQYIPNHNVVNMFINILVRDRKEQHVLLL